MKLLKYSFICLWSALLLTGCELFEEGEQGCMNTLATNYSTTATVSDDCSCKYDGVNANCGVLSPGSIVIPPIQQQTEVWCWLAVGEMVFRYYGLPAVNPAGDYQCGIVAAVGYTQNGACDACNINCGNCVKPAGSASMLSFMLSTYPKIACRNLFTANQTLKNTFVSNYLAPEFLVNELNQHRPVIAGINPGNQFILPGNSQHVALIKGYFYDGNNNLILRVNDPYPYWTKGFDPYVFHGAVSNGDLSYQIPYTNFVNGLLWNTSWFNIGW